jgi:predicted phage terminase large subunit-like protein
MVRRTHIKQGILDPIERQIENELIRREKEELPKSFRAFVEAAWPHIESSPFKTGLHIEAMCLHLQACAERRIKRLLVNVSPRSGKSQLISVLFPAWVLARNPHETLLFASYSEKLATRDSVKCRSLVESDWFQSRFPDVKIRDDSNMKTQFVLTSGGGRQCTSVGGTVTGLGGTFTIIDDPLNAKNGESPVVREAANTWFKESWYNRTAGDPDEAVRIVVMQRLAANDVSDVCIEAGWEQLILPAEYEGADHTTSLGWKDPRTEFGESMWPTHWSAQYLEDLKKTLGSFGWAAQYQQRPAPRGGGVFKRSWVKFWYDPRIVTNPKPELCQNDQGEWFELPQEAWAMPEYARPITSWDMAFKKSATTDYVVGQAWVAIGAKYYLLDQMRGRMDFPETCNGVRSMYHKHKPLVTLIEGKANGSAVISALNSELPALVEVEPLGGKESRAAAAAPLFEAGNVYLPHPAMCPWVSSYLDELCTFPRAPNDDIVDATTQALAHLRESRVIQAMPITDFKDAMDAEFDDDLIQPAYWS